LKNVRLIMFQCHSGDPMTLIIEPQPVPLKKNADGTWRVGSSRVLLDMVIHAFNSGRTPEEIVQSYDTLHLEDVYAVLAYYLAHRAEVNDYQKEQETAANTLWQEIKSRPNYQEFRNRLLARQASNNQ
jgi:uncharacterized protein (DUF433 family)